VRRELLEHFAIREELGPRSGPHLDHLESCAECRQEVGIDRELVRQLRRALHERVEGSAPPAASWELVRRRTVDQPVRPWAVRVLRWGGMLPAAGAAAIMLFAVATSSETTLLPRTESPVFVASLARQAGQPVEEARVEAPIDSTSYRSLEANPPLPGWPIERRAADATATTLVEAPIPGRMR
jgi:anti-sigma factor RsiW